jgi:hypothetical protein
MAEFAVSHHGVVTRSQAAAFGFTPRDILLAKQRGWLTEPVRGVLVLVGYPPSWEQRLAVAIAGSAVKPLVSNGASARLFTLDGFAEARGELTLLRPGRLNRRASEGIVVHQTSILTNADRYKRHGLPCTGLARTLVDLGSTEPADMVRRALISARRLHRVNPLWLQQTALRVHRPGQPGTGVMIRALRQWGAEGNLPESWFEELLRCMLVHPDIPAIVPQYVLTNDAGAFVARIDLAIPAACLGIEGHSREFHFGPIREAHDEDRDLQAAECGWELIYMGWYAQRRPAEVVQIIAKVCRKRMKSEVRTFDAHSVR